MNSRLEALIKRGYSRDVVEKLALFTEEELEYASKCAFKHISRNCFSVNNPNAIFIGGQPGCGKTVMSMNLKNELKNVIEIGIDNYRMYHPRYIEIENCIKEHWKDREENSNDTPGNDVADFTHFFAGAMTDKLIEMGKNSKYNMLLEWGMREPNGPLNSMRELKNNGYNNIVLFVFSDKKTSYEACNLRANIMKDSSRIIRKVPKNFHDLCVNTLPESINEIYTRGYKESLINYMALITRNSRVLWDEQNKDLPGNIYEKYINNPNIILNQNNPFLATETTKKEMEGLRKNVQNLKENFVYMDPTIFKVNSKIK